MWKHASGDIDGQCTMCVDERAQGFDDIARHTPDPNGESDDDLDGPFCWCGHALEPVMPPARGLPD